MKDQYAREEGLDAAFSQPETHDVAGLHLRPITLGTLNLARRLGLTILTDPKAAEQLSEEEATQQITTLAWMQSLEPREVINAIAEGTWQIEVDLFACGIEIGDLPKIMAEFNRLFGLVESAAVQVEDKPKKGKPSDEDQPPGN